MDKKRLEIEGLRQRLYDRVRDEEFIAYVEMNITLFAGDFVALLGPSGCGKTTLLSVLGLLRAPTELQSLKRFQIWAPQDDGSAGLIDLKQAWRIGNQHLIEKIRRRHFGFALQSGELITSLTVFENIAAPLRLNGFPRYDIQERVTSLVESFRLLHRIPQPSSNGEAAMASASAPSSLSRSRINRLSGGEYQRVVLARAIAHRPVIAFVDEPTSALNRELARGSLELLRGLQSRDMEDGMAGVTVMITHDEQFAADFANVIIRMAPRKNEAAGEVVEVVRTS